MIVNTPVCRELEETFCHSGGTAEDKGINDPKMSGHLPDQNKKNKYADLEYPHLPFLTDTGKDKFPLAMRYVSRKTTF